MIEAQDLTRHYGLFTAVKGVSFSVDEGEIVGILGPNGAGKTTTIRMITGFLPPSSGTVTVDGRDLFTEPKKARRDIGYLPENVALYPEMRVREYLNYRARLQGMARGEARDAIDQTIERCLLGDVEWQIINTLSKGYKQRVGLAAAILHGPRVLVLDEPTVGLDPKQIIAIRELIRDFGKKRTLLLSTHILPEVEAICDRVLIIDRGHLVAEGTPEELRRQSEGTSVLYVTVRDANNDAVNVLGGLAGVDNARVEDKSTEDGADDNALRFALECSGDVRADVFHAAVEQGWTLLELMEKKASLEDVFVRLTAAAAAGGAASAGGAANDAAPEEESEADASSDEENVA